eukprot:3310865-Rhodomonas_salina.1
MQQAAAPTLAVAHTNARPHVRTPTAHSASTQPARGDTRIPQGLVDVAPIRAFCGPYHPRRTLPG